MLKTAQLLIACLALLACMCNAETTLFTAKYKGKHSGLSITSTRELTQKDDGSYEFFSKVKSTFASIEETSIFTLGDEPQRIMIPQSYQYERRILGASTREWINFDWENFVAHYERKGKPEKSREHKLVIGMLDVPLYQLQLQRDLIAGKTSLYYAFVKPHKIKSLAFKVEGEDTIHVGNKAYKAIKVARINTEDDKETFVWLIPELNYQIGKIVHVEEDGSSYRIDLTSYQSSEKLFDNFYKRPQNNTGHTTIESPFNE
ncbi:DUF3108 domain-containing protein [Saccharophagus degradans]|uniref:DUF3108 domain-containing protein n=1 Tax=Saccharophagus degradans TaxID=86304 RepID=UPI001C086DBC|nr:DUF3108 domain-containing protein [Saccharophagus degradans]MBU2986028.1 DUF3108 domain-containing protein [Saccharophagus degradans]